MENQGKDSEERISSILLKMFKNMDIEDTRSILEVPQNKQLFIMTQ